ncbi:GspH/FimT family pseudopilin [Halanaerobaculum tunisiense]
MREQEAGFTLLEIILVITILSTLATMGIPKFTSYLQHLKLTTAVNNLVTDFQFAREQTISQDQQYGIVFKPDQNQYLVVKSKSQPQVVKRISLEEVNLTQVTFSQYDSTLGQHKAIFFQELGNLDGSNGRVILQLADLTSREIIFSSNAGQLTVK